jgi:pimeloyl-ACP methyl ester carboxylesterase
MSYKSLFKTPEGADKYLAAYTATLALWPTPPEAIEVTTSFGTTHINAAGSTDSPPLILLHGFAMSSTQWYPNVVPLSRHFRVYALDVINQMGRSVPTRRIQTPEDCTAWLIEVLDALNIERATFVGHSYGGWLSLNLALRAPHRVERMVLLSPAASFAKIAWQFVIQALPIFLLPIRPTIYRFFQRTTTKQLVRGQAEIEQMVMGIWYLKPQHLVAPIVSVYTDAELRQISQPTLLLIGEHEVIYKPSVVIERARRLIPHIEADVIAGGGHCFPIDQAEATNERMLRFLVGNRLIEQTSVATTN